MPVSEAGETDRRPPFRFAVRTRVDFSDTDAAGILYYGRYPRYLDKAVIAYRRHLGLGLLGEPGHQVVIRALAVEYHASAGFDDPIEVFVRTARIGRTSTVVEARVERLDEHGPVHLADGRLVIVGLSEWGGEPTPVPAVIRDAVTAFEGEALELG